jgi:hypothetical protein
MEQEQTAEEFQGFIEGVHVTPWISRPAGGPPDYIRYQIGGPSEGEWIVRAHVEVFAREGVYRWSVTTNSKVLRVLRLEDLAAHGGTCDSLKEAQAQCDGHLMAQSEFMRLYPQFAALLKPKG